MIGRITGGVRAAPVIGLPAGLAGSRDLHVPDPKGAAGVAEKAPIATATQAMLIVVVPVILLTLYFARFSAS